MIEKLGFAIIGCSGISSKHIEGIIRNYKDANLIAVCDLYEDKMDEAIDNYYNYSKENKSDFNEEVIKIMKNNKIKKYKDYNKLLNDTEINVVTIATDSGTHPGIAKDVLNAGKHVIVEKPMALSTKDADEMIKLAEKKGLKLSVCHQNRFNPVIQKLKEAIDDDRFGKLVHAVASVRWNRNDEYFNKDAWHGTLDRDGGIFLNQCIHYIDMLFWMMGDVKRLTAETDTFLRDIEIEDAGVASLRFRNGAIGLIEGTVCVYPRNLEETFSIFGEKGTVRLSGAAMNKVLDWKFADAVDNEEEKMKQGGFEKVNIYGYGHNLLFKDVIDSIRDDRKPLVDGREGKKAIETILAMYKSSRTGKPVEFPLGDYSTTTGVE